MENTLNTVSPQLAEKTIALGQQLAASAVLVLLLVVIHSLGLLIISNTLNLNSKKLKRAQLSIGSFALLGGMGLMIFALHILEIFVFAGFYMLVAHMGTLEEALYYSASAYATLGRTASYFPSEWRLMGAVEALIGFILIGWSTAFMVKTMNEIRD